MPELKERPKPFLLPEYCKGCGRCISACAKHCIDFGKEINSQTGLVPVVIDLDHCNACGLCITACPEPYGLRETPFGHDFELEDPAALFGSRRSAAPEPIDVPPEVIPLPPSEPLVIKGNYASAIGAILAGCRHFYGYPITPSTEGAELMAKLLPLLDGTFVQAVSEVATVNHIYGTGGAGLPCMTFTSSPGFSLMVEGLSYMIGSEVPGVFVNVMRGGPGLGNIAPEQADIKLAVRGLGHGNTHAIVLAPSTPQEMLDLTILAFDLTFRYRNPVVILSDGYLGQMTGKVTLPRTMKKPGIPTWAVYGDRNHRKNLITSIYLSETDLEKHNEHLNEKYARMLVEARSESYRCDEADSDGALDVLFVACNTPARATKGAVQDLRHQGVKAGLFRPLTLWPFPVDALLPLARKAKRLIVVEASAGQLEDEIRLALSWTGVRDIVPIEHVRRMGGMLPQQDDIVAKVQGSRPSVGEAKAAVRPEVQV